MEMRDGKSRTRVKGQLHKQFTAEVDEIVDEIVEVEERNWMKVSSAEISLASGSLLQSLL